MMNEIDLYIISFLKQHNKLPSRDDYHKDANTKTNELTFTFEQFVDRLKQIKKYRKTLKSLKDIPIVQQRTPEWFQKRKNMLSASDTYRGIKKYKDLIKKKARGLLGVPDGPMLSNNAIQWGVMFEPVANEIYSAMHHNIKIHEFGLIQDKTIDCYGASPDGINDIGIMLEIKCPYSRDIIHGKVKDEYYYQVQGQLAVCNLKECDFVECKFSKIDQEEYNTILVEQPECFCGFIQTIIDTETGDKTYTYSKLKEPCCISNPEASDGNDDGNDDSNDITYWKLDDIHILRIHFDEEKWITTIVPEIKSFWDNVLETSDIYKKHPYMYSTHHFIEDSD